ncbi:ComEC/Rec2 family competence protein [Aeromicrobium massiliense]|uniref:ComEC/Rec2 family competence protein n=1 Tax=Aeromicrobium massiliense TaxID=1464554 RepID=UPI000AB33B9E|nr:ComEC/Rec2 family competence protein [Aeromicrobium massiliense]
MPAALVRARAWLRRAVHRHDLRMVPAAAAAWAVAAVVLGAGSVTGLAVAMGGLAVLLVALLRRRPGLALVAAVVAGVAAGCAWRLALNEHGPVPDLAADGAVASVEAQVRSDPRTFVRAGRTGVVVSLRVERITTRHGTVTTRALVTAFGDESAAALVVGQRLTARLSLAPADRGPEVATARLLRLGPVQTPPWWWGGAQDVRDGVARAAAQGHPDGRALVPALVDGDERGLTDELREDFRRSGLTHLLAVSGTNLTIVLACLLALARVGGVPPRWTWVVGVAAVVGFVLLARAEPSVVRAAAMGLVGIAAAGLGSRGGTRALAWAVVVLLLVDPWLALRPGFVLSVSATAGILLLVPPFADALGRWMPRWAAVALAVPLAAQLACTPAVAVLSGEVSLVAVLANLLAAPAVAPATVLGLGAGLLALLPGPWAVLPGWLAGWCGHWIASVGRWSAGLPGASVEWGAPWWVLALLCVVLAVGLHRAARRPALAVGLCLGLVVVLVRPPQPGWPPRGWLMVACDVGQGDATVVDVGGAALVVDAGPDPTAADACLDRLGVRRVAAVVLTHAHADHVDGLPGVLEGRAAGPVVVGPGGGRGAGDEPVRQVAAGDRLVVGAARVEVVGPVGPGARVTDPSRDEHGGEGSAVNDASLVLRVQVRGVVLLLTGDVEPSGQDALLRAGADVSADVLKMPHHGSARQSRRFVEAVGARLATVSAGRDNSYGHPSATALDLLRDVGTSAFRTDRDGDLAVVLRDGRLAVVTR